MFAPSRTERVRETRRPGAGRRAIALGVVLATAGMATLASVSGQTPSSARSPYAASYPDGPGRAIAERACLICHSAMLVTQQAKDSTGWEKSLATMVKWGAPLTPAEQDTLRGYLLASFGPRKKG